MNNSRTILARSLEGHCYIVAGAWHRHSIDRAESKLRPSGEVREEFERPSKGIREAKPSLSLG